MNESRTIMFDAGEGRQILVDLWFDHDGILVDMAVATRDHRADVWSPPLEKVTDARFAR